MTMISFVGLICFMLAINNNNVYSQKSKDLDSMEWLLRGKLSDSMRFYILEDLSWNKREVRPLESFLHGKSALALAKAMSSPSREATALNRIADYYMDVGKLDSAEYVLIRAIHIEDSMKHYYGLGRAYARLSDVNRKCLKIDVAILNAKTALKYFQKADKKTSVARAYNRLGSLYRQSGFYDSATHVLRKALKIQKKQKNQFETGNTLLVLGNLYTNIHYYDSALNYLFESEKIFSEIGNFISLSDCKTNIAASLIHQNENNSAERYTKESIDIREKYGLSNAGNLNNLGLISIRRGNLEMASAFFQEGLLETRNGDKRIRAEILNNLGFLYQFKNDYRSSAKYLLEALSIIDNSEQRLQKLNIYLSLSKSYIQMNKKEKALFFQKKYSSLKDSIESMIRSAYVQQINLKEQEIRIEILTKNQQAQAAKLERQAIKERTFFIVLLLILVITFLIGWLYRQRKVAQLKSKDDLIIRKSLENQLKKQNVNTLSAMIDGREIERKRVAQDLHDRLGSMLSMVKLHFKNVEDSIENVQHGMKTQYGKANDLLDEACDEVRQISYDLSSGVLNRFGLIPALNTLKEMVESSGQMKVNLLRFNLEGNRISDDIDLDLYRIIQEILSNTIRHSKATQLTLQLIKTKSEITLMAEDNGVGFDPSKLKTNEGMGIGNIQSRVDRLSGELNIDSGLGAGTTITIDIPLNQKNND